MRVVTIGALILLFLFANYAFSEYNQKTEQLKEYFREGFFITCEPTIKSQLQRAGLLDQYTTRNRINYCTCVAIKIFDDLTEEGVNYFWNTGELPIRKKKARPEYSNQCFDSEFI